MDRTEHKFGPCAASTKVPSAVAGQFLCACVILIVVQPPFVCDADGTLRAQTVVALATASTLAAGLAAASDASCADIFRGAVEFGRSGRG